MNGTGKVRRWLDPPHPKRGLEKDVLLTGYLEQESEDLAYLYGGAEVFLFPSYWEGWASPPLEAMASGVPVVASDILRKGSLGDFLSVLGLPISKAKSYNPLDAAG